MRRRRSFRRGRKSFKRRGRKSFKRRGRAGRRARPLRIGVRF